MAEVDYTTPIALPPPQLNGGLYTGAPFLAGAPWANVPMKPDTVWLTQNGFKALVPEGNRQFADAQRPGNNEIDFNAIQQGSGYAPFGREYNFIAPQRVLPRTAELR